MAKALAVRVRFPAWSASVRSRHLSIVTCRSARVAVRSAQNRIRGVVANIAPPCGQSRSSTAIEHPDSFSGDVGSIPIGRAIFDGPLSMDYR